MGLIVIFVVLLGLIFLLFKNPKLLFKGVKFILVDLPKAFIKHAGKQQKK